MVPKAAFLGVIDSARSDGTRHAEVIVDYEALPPSAFKDLNPLASEAEQLAAIELQRDGARRPLAA